VEVSDSNKARGALNLLAIVFFAHAALGLISMGVPALINTAGGADAFQRWSVAQQGLWLAVTLTAAFGVFQLTRSVREPEPLFAVLGAFGLLGCLELYGLSTGVARLLDGPHPSPQWLTFTLMVVSLAAQLGLCVTIGKLGRNLPFAAGIGVFMVVRSLAHLAVWRSLWGDSGRHLPPSWLLSLLGILGIGVTLAMGGFALHARGALTGAPSRAAGELPAPTDLSSLRLILTGVALLALGIGGTALSYSLTSSAGGGRYVIATGAIATGLVQLVRGVARLGR
jgi:hypothetical protein